ncbi:MAG: MauE/DoxX family redox-associated membrane protein [Pseudomonadota bacterium]
MKIIRFLVLTDYYLASVLLIWAGIVKMQDAGVGDLLESLLERHILTIDQIIFISNWSPPLEILVGTIALIGIKAGFFSRILGCLYLAFTLLILYVSEGYLLLPVDCGCFGTGHTSPVYLLVLRNLLIALPLFFFPRACGNAGRPTFLYSCQER